MSDEPSGPAPTAAPRTGPATSDLVVRRVFVAIAFAEALSWIGLLAGMYVKYVPKTSEAGVHVFGPIHGGVFMIYVVSTIVAAVWFRWSWKVALVGLACSIPPFATVFFERYAVRRGLLDGSRGRGRATTDQTPDATAPSSR